MKNQITRPDSLFTGDAISDLRTQGNTISVWETPDLLESNVSPILATLALNGDKLDKVVYVTLNEKDLTDKGLILVPAEGRCDSIVDMSILQRHRDISEVDYWHLGFLAEYIYERIALGFVYTATLSTIKSYVQNLIDTQKVDAYKIGGKKREQLHLPALF